MSAEQDERENIVNRIRKILAKVKHEGGATETPEAEIEASLKMARKLMDKFNIAEAEIDTSNDKRDAFYESIKSEEIYSRAGTIDVFDLRLAYVLDNLLDIGHYTSRAYREGKQRQVLHFYGPPKPVAIGRALYMELLATMRAMVRLKYGKGWSRDHDHYCAGFAERLVQRSMEFKKESQTEAGTTAIVLCKERLLNQWANNFGLVPSRARGLRNVNGSVYADGYSDADSVSLDTRGISNSAGAKPRQMR